MENAAMTVGYLNSQTKNECYGCEACSRICPKNAITMTEDVFGFRYPLTDSSLCIGCGLCHRVCPVENHTTKNVNLKSFGGYIIDRKIREQSTSGGAFSALLNAFFSRKGIRHFAYGVVAKGLIVYHEVASRYEDCEKYRSSKYIQSSLCTVHNEIEEKLKKGFYVLFSGTPCQVSGLVNYLSVKNIDQTNLYTIEVLCAGVPSPLLFQKYNQWLSDKNGYPIETFFWRYKDRNRWDYNCCSYTLQNGKCRVIDRWFSGYWSMFTQRLLMRPSCERCTFKGAARVSDISLGDLWGVDREYPELYDGNRGTSWILCNTKKGIELFENAKSEMVYSPVEFDRMKKYQVPSISGKPFHPQYEEFMEDLTILDYSQLCKKWAKKPSPRLLFQKYVFNNHMRVRIWKIKMILKKKVH